MKSEVPNLLLVVAIITSASLARASDGVLEINQTCATQTGCFSGDTAGFPVTIDGSAGRSYRLTSDLSIANENTDGIVPGAPNISIDLNGFAIVGPVVCTILPPLTCSPSTGTGSGVEDGPGAQGTSVKNGSIIGMGRHGVAVGDNAQVTNLRVRWNRLNGIQTAVAAIIAGNTAAQNGRTGIAGSAGSTIIGNTAFNNGDVANPSFGYGISCEPGCLVRENSSVINSRYGIVMQDSSSAFSDNVVTFNAIGTISGGVDAGGNVCEGSLTCP